MGQGARRLSEMTTNKEQTTEHRGGCLDRHHRDGSKGSRSDQTTVPSLGTVDRVVDDQWIKDSKQHETETTIPAT
jgi:hypothetical protein